MSSKNEINQFVDTNDDEIEELLLESKAKNTQRSTQAALRKFSKYLIKHELLEEGQLKDEQLPGILTKFYTDVRSSITGERFKTGSLKVIRAGLNRHFKVTRSIDIVADDQFRRANLVFDGVQVKAKKEGKGVTKSTPHISPEDLAVLGEYFYVDHITRPHPKKLQQAVQFYIMYFFCWRGQENLYDMKKNHFELIVQPDGSKFVRQAIDEKDKNHGVNDTEMANQAKMYEQPGK